MAKSSKPAAAPEIVAAYERLVATIPGLVRKGATMPYTSVNGNMTSYVDKAGRLEGEGEEIGRRLACARAQRIR